jgi:hypothetical protein
VSTITKYFDYMKSCIFCGRDQINMDKETTGKRLLVRIYCPNGCTIIERSCLLNGTPEENAAKEDKTVKNAIEGWRLANTRGPRRW